MKPTRALITTNAAYAHKSPRLSVLIPFYRDSPVPLLKALENTQDFDHRDVEIVILDDGSSKPELYHEVATQIASMSVAVKFVCLSLNEGRSRGRNRLAFEARGGYYLFLDADMLPDSPDFILSWLELMTHAYPAVAFGGFSLKQAPQGRRYALHRAMASHSDCLSAERRRQAPEKYLFTSNLLIRAGVFADEHFDTQFYGWGWEDVEWAMRMSANHELVHIDNTATHMGLDATECLLRKYEQSVNNFARILKKHPAIVSNYPCFNWARRLRSLPALRLWRGLFRDFAQSGLVPLKLRATALRLYRASLYARVV
jgi:glycosyltransferase involved in cell wall biosynthesis